jgi:hypothetical protein
MNKNINKIIYEKILENSKLGFYNNLLLFFKIFIGATPVKKKKVQLLYHKNVVRYSPVGAIHPKALAIIHQ